MMEGLQQLHLSLTCHGQNEAFPRRTMTLSRGEKALIGRSTRRNDPKLTPSQHNVMFNSPVISRKHAEIIRHSDSVSIKDLGSMHGTYVNGVRITQHVLKSLRDGDTVKIGRTFDQGEMTARTITVHYTWEQASGPSSSALADGGIPSPQSPLLGRKITVPVQSDSEDDSVSEDECEVVEQRKKTDNSLPLSSDNFPGFGSSQTNPWVVEDSPAPAPSKTVEIKKSTVNSKATSDVPRPPGSFVYVSDEELADEDLVEVLESAVAGQPILPIVAIEDNELPKPAPVRQGGLKISELLRPGDHPTAPSNSEEPSARYMTTSSPSGPTIDQPFVSVPPVQEPNSWNSEIEVEESEDDDSEGSDYEAESVGSASPSSSSSSSSSEDEEENFSSASSNRADECDELLDAGLEKEVPYEQKSLLEDKSDADPTAITTNTTRPFKMSYDDFSQSHHVVGANLGINSASGINPAVDRFDGKHPCFIHRKLLFNVRGACKECPQEAGLYECLQCPGKWCGKCMTKDRSESNKGRKELEITQKKKYRASADTETGYTRKYTETLPTIKQLYHGTPWASQPEVQTTYPLDCYGFTNLNMHHPQPQPPPPPPPAPHFDSALACHPYYPKYYEHSLTHPEPAPGLTVHWQPGYSGRTPEPYLSAISRNRLSPMTAPAWTSPIRAVRPTLNNPSTPTPVKTYSAPVESRGVKRKSPEPESCISGACEAVPEAATTATTAVTAATTAAADAQANTQLPSPAASVASEEPRSPKRVKTEPTQSGNSSTKAFVLGTLVGGVGILGALIGLPESFF